jgi:hypothetical protein
VWPEDVVSAGSGLCDQVMKIIEETGLDEDGGVAYANQVLTNAFDDQNNYLHKGRQLLLTMSINYIPPLAASRDGSGATLYGEVKMSKVEITFSQFRSEK